MIRLRHLALVLAVAGSLGTSACGRFMHSGQPVAQVIFANESLDQADVYAVLTGGQSQRIGTVFAGRTETLDVPTNIISAGGTVNIVARLLAHAYAPSTGPLTLNPGDRIRVTLPATGRSLSVLPAPE
ncbi:MAG TPA: hypothetical protein VFY85_00705 [Gemmatimonadaceae bacterium]|nr:hypothetical protein [Gemmatimonadaceae bacterium]